MPSATGGGSEAAPAGASDESTITSQLNSLVPTFDPSTDDVNIWTGKVELILSAWPKNRVAELATRLILGCKGSVFLKLQQQREAICVNDPKGIKKLVEIVGGSWGQIPLERKYELAEKALYKCIQKGDETSDSYLTRCDVVWSELMARNMKISELQAYIMLRGSRLSTEDKKRVLIDSGADTGGTLEMSRVTAAVRMLGAGFFQEMTGLKKEKSLKVYDSSAFIMDDDEEQADHEALVMDDQWEDDQLETLAAENDEDAALVIQFEDAVMETIQQDQELNTYFASYQDARRRLAEKGRVRGFWPVRRSIEKGKKGLKGKSKGKGQSLASRIANSYCRICFKRGHWKDECPNNPSNKSGASSSSPAQVPTSFVIASDVPPEIAHLPHAAGVSSSRCEEIFFGVTIKGDKTVLGHRFQHRFAKGLKCQLRNIHRRDAFQAVPQMNSGVKREVDCPSSDNHPGFECQHSYFASSGTTGVVDLGASQTVIGSQQIPELLEKLPEEIRSRVKRTDCHLVFRFGNHQTLTSQHAILLPVLDTWFRIAIVKGNTPFLLSSDFLRKTIQAVIDTEAGTIWSKRLNKQLDVEITSKNLFLMDITQLWSADPGHAQPIFTSQVQPVEELDGRVADEKQVVEAEPKSVGERVSFKTLNTQGLTKENTDEKLTPCTIHPSTKSHVSCPTSPNIDNPVQSGSSNIEGTLQEETSPNRTFSHVSVPTTEAVPKGFEQEQGGRRAGGDPMDVPEGPECREDCLWKGQDRNTVSGSISGPFMDRLVCGSVREVTKASPQEVCQVRRTTTQCRDGEPGLFQQASGEAQDDSHKVEGSTQGSGCSLLDPCDSRRDRRGGHPSGNSLGRGSEPDEGGESDGKCTSEWTGERNAGSDCPPEAIPGQIGTVKESINESQVASVDLDFEFVMNHETTNLTRRCKKLIRQIETELGDVISHEALFPHKGPKLDMLEVMCSPQSEITKQTVQLGGQGLRFGLAEGDLQQIENRKKLFQGIVRRKPRSIWFSPECAPWCAWSNLNCSKGEVTLQKILEAREQNLWQLALAVVLFRYQKAVSRHFHLEQPFGSLMLLMPCVQEIVDQTSRCCFDMCRMGELRNPNNDQFIRKRLVVQTTSNALRHLLDGKTCHRDHLHQHIAGSIRTPAGNIALSKFTENYPKKFARQVVRTLLLEKEWDIPVYVGEEEVDHPTKRRRLGSKKSPAEIAQLFTSVNWQTVLKVADTVTPRVGLLLVHSGDLMQMIEKLHPNHQIHHIVLCRGTDRYVGPSQTMPKGVAPLRKRACIRRRFEDIQVDDEWESWERLTQKGLRRKDVAARVSLTIFASLKTSTVGQPSTSADATISREAPQVDYPTPKRRCHREEKPDASQSPGEDKGITETSREVIDFESNQHGPLFLNLNKEERIWLLKIHRNLGHPGAAKLTEFCRQLGCPPHVIAGIQHLRCSTCLETAKPTIPRPGAIHEPEDFGDTISMDGVTWTNQQGQQFHFYHFVCHSTAFQTAVCSPSRTTEMAIKALMQGWINWAGPPSLLCVDAATELNSEEFLTFNQKHNVCVRTIATDAHWQNSRAERHGGILQEILKKMDQEEAINSYDQLEIALGFATSVKNQWSRHRGYPPEVLVFGKQRQVPASIHSDSKSASHGLAASMCPEGVKFRQELATRERARKAFVEIDNDQVMRRAVLQRNRPPRQSYEKGHWVMMWRKRGENQGQWIGPAQVLLHEGPQVTWTSMGSRLYRIAPEHLRPLSAVEEQKRAQSREPINQQAPIGQGVTQFQDLTIQGAQPQETEVPIGSNGDQLEIPPVGNESAEEIQPGGNSNSPEEHSQVPGQPDQEPSVCSIPSNNTSENHQPEDPSNIPIPDTDSENLFVEEAFCFACTPNQVWKFEIEVTQKDIDRWREETRPSEMAFIVSAAKKQRAEVKLADLTREDQKLFDEAKSNEIDSWISTETIARVLRHKIPKENIMRCRWILTWKPIDEEGAKSQSRSHPNHKPKARLVVLGFQDPMVDSIPRDSPTLTKLSRMMILQMAASKRWSIGSFDVKTAFLRGEEHSERILGIEPPSEIRQRLQLGSNEVLQLLKGAYGRVDAPYLWFMELKRGLEEIGFIQAPFDPCMYLLEHKGITQGVIGVHVDDGLCCGTPYFQEKLKQLEQKFPFGSRKEMDFTFTGLHISQKADGTITVDQSQYVNEIEPVHLEKGRRFQGDDAVTEQERQGLRAVIGSLQYAAINTRPDLCHRLGLLQSAINRAKVSHLLEANKLLHEAKRHSGVSLILHPIDTPDVRFVAFSDASFASEKCPDSYQGTVIMAAHRDIATNRTTRINPIAWQSKKIQRVAVSTLSAETMALAGTTDLLTWIRLYWAWINDKSTNWRDVDSALLKLPHAFSALPEEALNDESGCKPPEEAHKILQGNAKSNQKDSLATDCKSLYDLISKTAPPACQEFRTLLQARLIREHLKSGIQIRWVPSGAQIADSLTKAMDPTMLRECLRLGVYSLHDEAEILRARSDARSRLQWLHTKATSTEPKDE